MSYEHESYECKIVLETALCRDEVSERVFRAGGTEMPCLYFQRYRPYLREAALILSRMLPRREMSPREKRSQNSRPCRRVICRNESVRQTPPLNAATAAVK